MDFVITTLTRFFDLGHKEAREVMVEAHNNGKSIVGVMPLERAEFKIQKAHEYAREHSYPLTFSIEPV